MADPRRGLHRDGLRGYVVVGPCGVWRIERDKRSKYYVARDPIMRPAGLFAQKFNRLTAARRYAEGQAGLLPKRLQRRRVKGFHLPPGTICVTRPGRDGNPFRVGDERTAPDGTVYYLTPAQAKAEFRAWITAPEQREHLEDAKRRLRGHSLACFCPIGTPCHADDWLELVNQ